MIVSDPDQRGDDLGVLLYSAGARIVLDDSTGAQFLMPNGSSSLPVVGTVDELNSALRGVRVTQGSEATLHAGVLDLGHGTFGQSRDDSGDIGFA